MDIKAVFEAKADSLWHFMSGNGKGFFIPAYQRDYSWNKSKIERLIDDASQGFTLLLDNKEAFTFLGTIITIIGGKDNKDADNDPTLVSSIIDGQQRLTTLLILNTVMHEEIKIRVNNLTQEGEEAVEWIKNQCKRSSSQLAATYEEKPYDDTGDFAYYPRVIRAFDDKWSQNPKVAKYNSPLGLYLHAYGDYGRTNSTNGFKIPQHNEPQHKLLYTSRKTIQTLIKVIIKPDSKSSLLSFPDTATILRSSNLQQELVGDDFPEYVLQHLSRVDQEEYKELVRLVLFANFILHRVALTIVEAKNEDYAFDMFESLNTTGEPLTAFETFKPRVIAAEGLSNYKDSTSFEYIKDIEDHLKCFTKSDEKQDATSRLIVAFALAESGEKQSRRLNNQRRYLLDGYEKGDYDYQKNFTRHLSHTAIFMQDIWPHIKKERPNLTSIFGKKDEDELALLCIDFLRQFNHTITIAPLVRFYSQYLTADVDKKDQAAADFITAVKAITAFSVLWRSSRDSTGGIDAHYRRLMLEGYLDSKLVPLCRCTDEGKDNDPLDVLKFKTALIEILKNEGKISTKEEWVRATSIQPIYEINQDIARFLLLAAMHDSVPSDTPGLIKKGKPGSLPLLNFKSWRGPTLQTIEHIAPGKGSETWANDIYENKEGNFINRLGNLTLLPLAENASISNRPWDIKVLFYKLLSAPQKDTSEQLIQEAKDKNIILSPATLKLIEESAYLPLITSISKVTDWNSALIKKRSESLAELAWDNIFPLLEVQK